MKLAKVKVSLKQLTGCLSSNGCNKGAIHFSNLCYINSIIDKIGCKRTLSFSVLGKSYKCNHMEPASLIALYMSTRRTLFLTQLNKCLWKFNSIDFIMTCSVQSPYYKFITIIQNHHNFVDITIIIYSFLKEGNIWGMMLLPKKNLVKVFF